MTARNVCVCVFAALGTAASVSAGPDWVEVGDAGPLLGSAQQVLGVGQLETITGTLGGALGRGFDPDFEDMYLMRITQPSMFAFQPSAASFNAQCFLFNITLPGEAFGLLAADDTATSNLPRLISPATDGTGAAVVLPGVYALAISGFGRDPVSHSGRIFHFASTTEISGPDGPGGINPHTGWIGEGQTGSYVVQVEGMDFYDVPAPGGAVVMLGGMVILAGRRRR